MALVGHISGSSQTNSLIGVSGTVIIANRPDALFPSALPGADVSFFVSGSRGGKGGSTRTVSLFGGDAVISGSLTVGTGSLLITSNDIQFSSPTNRIELSGNDIIFFDGNNLTGRTVSSLATSSPAGSNTYVQFNDSGSLGAESAFSYEKATDTLAVVNSLMTAVTAAYIVPNSSVNSSIVSLMGDLKLTGNDIIASDDSYSIQLEGSSNVKVGGDLTVGGNDIKASNGTTALTLDTSGNVSVAGDLTVTGNDIKSSGGNTAITLTAAGNVIIPGDLTVNGTTVTADVTTVTIEDPLIALGFTSGSTAVTAGDRGFVGGISGGNNVAVFWDNSESEFAVARTTSSPEATAISVASYGNFHANNIVGNIITASLGFSGSHTKLVDGTSAFIAGSGIQITSASNGAVTITSTATATPGGSDTQVQFNDGGSTFGGDSGLTYNKTTDTLTGVTASFYRGLFSDSVTISGAATLGDASSDTITVNGTTTFAGGSVTTTFAGDIAVNGGDITTSAGTATLFNTNASTLSMAGAASSILIGSSSCAVGIGGASPSNSTITASTGSFGRVLASSTSTFTGATTHNGGISTTTLGVSSTATLQSTLSVTGNITGQGTANQLNALSVTGSLGLSATSLSVTNGASVTGSLTLTGATILNGNVTLGDASADTVTVNGSVGSNILPVTDRLYNLGSATQRWANVYTGDLHLRNERGNWTVIEEEQYLSIRNNHTGKMYKFVLEEIVDPVEE